MNQNTGLSELIIKKIVDVLFDNKEDVLTAAIENGIFADGVKSLQDGVFARMFLDSIDTEEMSDARVSLDELEIGAMRMQANEKSHVARMNGERFEMYRKEVYAGLKDAVYMILTETESGPLEEDMALLPASFAPIQAMPKKRRGSWSIQQIQAVAGWHHVRQVAA